MNGDGVIQFMPNAEISAVKHKFTVTLHSRVKGLCGGGNMKGDSSGRSIRGDGIGPIKLVICCRSNITKT